MGGLHSIQCVDEGDLHSLTPRSLSLTSLCTLSFLEKFGGAVWPLWCTILEFKESVPAVQWLNPSSTMSRMVQGHVWRTPPDPP